MKLIKFKLTFLINLYLANDDSLFLVELRYDPLAQFDNLPLSWAEWAWLGNCL